MLPLHLINELFIFAIFLSSIICSVFSSSIMTDFNFLRFTLKRREKIFLSAIEINHQEFLFKGIKEKARKEKERCNPLKYKPQLKVNILFMAWLFQLKSTKLRIEKYEKSFVRFVVEWKTATVIIKKLSEFLRWCLKGTIWKRKKCAMF